ncbi:SDR family NAD(P)-dependent oxidoreductase [Pigmentiphaga sp.]|jgi:Dehydrogenases with different specificities (related to short-chain alcohol dehydrogenases)|uniref:SDR family NAD(P)-dependent oxidoreductase n=1 Tax=Pigmentiphaga sp. TaxID=1977564 RepID=UPI0025E3A52F|nr:SDR family oxidoreductase [Pigmentiphaga sp.]MBX6316958.1 SDR family oxidoreductase [Pigmentiphaga sp.]
MEKVCLVTGSTGRNAAGSATIKYFAKQGWRVVVHYSRDTAAAEEVAEECRKLGAADVLVAKADVTSDEACRAMAAEIEQRWGRLDLLVNNAAVTTFNDHKNLDGLSFEDFQRVFAVNVSGVYVVTRAVATLLRGTGGASVINISSVGGLRGTGSSMAYAASKSALNAMTFSLARVLAPEVRVNALLPGFIEGDWMIKGVGQERYDALRAALIAKNPLKSVQTPEDIAEAVWWLAHGPAALTGELIQIDSGGRLVV